MDKFNYVINIHLSVVCDADSVGQRDIKYILYMLDMAQMIHKLMRELMLSPHSYPMRKWRKMLFIF